MTGLARTGRPNPSRETKISGANGDREQNNMRKRKVYKSLKMF